MAWSNTRHFESWYGISGIGAISHTINPRLFEEQIIYIINDAKDKLLLIDIDFVDLVEKLSSKLLYTEAVVILCDKEEMPEINLSISSYCYEDLLEKEDDDFSWPEFDENTASSLCYTSGTTGNPKGVLYAHRSTIIHTLAAAAPDVLSISVNDVIMPIAPMFHANAWGIPYVATMVGAKLVLPGRHLDGESVHKLLNEEKVTFTAAVPTIWLMLFEFLKKSGENLESLERCVVGGSACPRSMMKTFLEEYNVKVIHAWGMTETSPLGTINMPLPKHKSYSLEQMLDLSVKQGRAMYGVELKITDDNENTLPNNGKAFGNLWVRGPWICSGYLNIKESKSNRKDGWFYTGDVATIDSDGYMHITDRAKDVIKSGGEWISSIEIENIAIGHQGISEAAVIGVKHKKWDERPILLVVKTKDSNLTKDDIFNYLTDKIAKWWIPDDIIFVESLPHTATGKVRKTELREIYSSHLVSV